MKFNKILRLSALGIAFTGIAIATTSVHAVSAAKGNTGVDWSVYQGTNGKFGYSGDKFVIAQVGGTYNGTFINQSTYKTQVSSAIAAGKRAHTYIWYQVGGSTAVAKAALDHFLPMVQTPKGSIVALDYEAGASGNRQANTAAIVYGLKRIKDAGYTPMLYGYKSYLVSHTDLATIAKTYQLWLAEYPNYQVTTKPNYNYFPSFDNIGIFQFTSMYKAGGLDGNIDLTGITDNGYGKAITSTTGKVTVKPETSTVSTKAGKVANRATKASITKGTKVKVNLGAKYWATGQAIPSYVKGSTYTVQQVSGNKVLLAGILSWINNSNVEILQTATQASNTSKSSSNTFDYAQYGSFRPSVKVNVRTSASTSGLITGSLLGYTIHYNHVYVRGGIVWARYNSYTGVRYVALGINGGQSYGSRTGVSAASTATVSHTYYTVKSGDSFWSIGSKYGVSMYTIAQRNGMSVNHVIHPGQTLLIK